MNRAFVFVLAALASCSAFGQRTPEVVPAVPVAALPGHDRVPIDTAPKEEPRLVPAEAWMRTYLQLFGGLAPLEVQKKARGADGQQLFDTFADYLAILGFPDHKEDIPRAGQTNALMLGAFERVGIALCDRAAEHDLGPNAAPVAQRVIFAFATIEPGDVAAFAAPFDVLHRTFLGYPAKLAPTDRTARFHALFRDVVARHRLPSAPTSKLSPAQAGWAAVCQGLVRHPEFHLY